MNFLKQVLIRYSSRNLSSINSCKSNPVSLAYNSYESNENSNDVAPVIIMHGLFGSKQNWKSICKALQSKSQPSRKVRKDFKFYLLFTLSHIQSCRNMCVLN